MIVIPKLKLLLTHTPKTGGSAITEALFPWIDEHLKENAPEVGMRGWQTRYHRGGMHSRPGPWARTLIEDEGYRHAATLRNPFRRVESFFAYHESSYGGSFQAFCDDLPVVRRGVQRGGRGSLYPATYLTKGLPVHWWIHQERLQDDLYACLRGLGVRGYPKVRRRNERPTGLPTRPLRELFTEETVARVAEVYAKDIELGGYEAPEV